MRKEIRFNEEWLFHKGDIPTPPPASKGPVYTQSKTERKLIGPASYHYADQPDGFAANGREMQSARWQWVSIPHDYVVDQDLCESQNNALGYLRYDNAWYRKHFTLEQEDQGRRILLCFQGIAGKSTVYLNGCLMCRNFSAYNTFEVEITDHVYFDRENILAVYVNTEEFEGWWYQGGGIYRDVYLKITDPVAIDLYGVYAPCRKLSQTQWQIDFQTTVINTNYEDCEVVTQSCLKDKDGNTVLTAAGTGTIPLREKGVIRYSATVQDPALWGTDDPNLYIVQTGLFVNGREVDTDVTKIGFRTVEFTPQGMYLNGKKTFINGVCAHQDAGLFGLAVPENVARYKMRLIKEMGANGYRTSHYQQTASYLDACDALGLLVMDETRWFESTQEGLDQLASLVKRDRNRPSVIMWSTSNEEPFHVTENGKKIHRAMAHHIKKLDATRVITAAEDKTPDLSTIYDDCDVIGINYNLGLYDTVHAMSPEKPVFASECCAVGTSRDWCFPTNTGGRIRDFDADTNSWFLGREKTYKHLRQREYVFGCYQWAAVEHRGEAVWPRICSASGAIDLFLQKKGAFYQNKSHWTKEPMVHIVPHWNFPGLEGQEIFVPVYTNCEELELFLNGDSLGRKPIEQYGHGEWSVKYAPGILTAKGYVQGREAARDQRETTGKAVRLTLTLDNDVSFNGRDVVLVTCACVDQSGRPVPDAEEYVSFCVNAPARILATGSDNCDHIRVTDHRRKMYMGKISVAVKPEQNMPELVLLASSANCGTAMLRIPCPESLEDRRGAAQ